MMVSSHIRKLISAKLDMARVVVWYDSERAFGDFIQAFSAPGCHVVSAKDSRLRARREAELIYRQMNASELISVSRANLLIYLPFKRSIGDAQLQDPFEVFAAAGDVFGDEDSERLESLACQALPDMVDQIEQVFEEGEPTLAMLDQLERKATYPLVRQALGTQSIIDVTAQLLGDPETVRKITGAAGCSRQTLHLLGDELGFVPAPGAKQWEDHRAMLARYVLFSELAFDLPGDLPPALVNVPHAEERYREPIHAIAERLRDTASYLENYVDMAMNIERELGLPVQFAGITVLGQRDTFAFEERQHLVAFVEAIETDQREAAREIILVRTKSVWRHAPERAQIWKVAERCMAFLDVADRIGQQWTTEARSVGEMVTAYAREGGWSELDRHQRLMEQSIAECTACEQLENVITRCRVRYREVIDIIQKRFLKAVEETAWPPEGVLRHSQVFDRFIAPALAAREKVAYVLADSLRFEMGQDLAGALSSLGETDVQLVAASLPTVTSVGMAALMPGADGALTLREVGEELIPHLGGQRVNIVADRTKILTERLGDRIVDIEISEFLSLTSAARQKARLKGADLVVLRDSRIDRMGESVTLREARKFMTDLLGDLKAAVIQLIRLDYCYVVIATDHGHVLLPEILPGDVVRDAPSGTWLLRKRRSLLGRQVKEERGTKVFSAVQVGVQGDATEFVVPSGFGVYSAGSGYLHGGLSLQECVLPLVTLRARGRPAEQVSDQLEIRYRSDRFTSRVIGLRVWFNSLVESSLRAKIEAFDGPGASARKVGDAADCEARDEITREVTLHAGQETQVPLLLDPDFRGDEVEIRATNPEAPVVWARLTLKNEMLD